MEPTFKFKVKKVVSLVFAFQLLEVLPLIRPLSEKYGFDLYSES